jgi:DNA-binding MarR family transcriptional regulator
MLLFACKYTFRATQSMTVKPNRSQPCACARLRRASRALTSFYDEAIAPAGLAVTQFSLLRTLDRTGAVRLTTLAAMLLLDRTSLSRNLDCLIERGFVDVAPGRDARTREIAITRAGKNAVRAAEPHWQRAQTEVAKRLGAAKLETLITTLAEIESLHPAPQASDEKAVGAHP